MFIKRGVGKITAILDNDNLPEDKKKLSKDSKKKEIEVVIDSQKKDSSN